MEVAFLWDLLENSHEPTRNMDFTWLDVGFRSKYGMYKKYASLEIIEKVFVTPVFVRGPHDGDMNFDSQTSFGYYSPVFIMELRSSIETALKNPVYKKVVKELYNEHLKGMALTYQDAYKYLMKDPKRLQQLQSEYLMMISQPEGTSEGSLQETFRAYADQVESPAIGAPQRDWYEAVTAPAFWLRRSIDGTSGELSELLDMVIKEMEK